MMFGVPGGFGGFGNFGLTLSQSVEDATTVFQDAFDAFEPTREELLPLPPTRKKSSVEVPASSSQYEWSQLPP